MRLIGRFFKGVVASGTLPPDAAQDVATVNADRGRIIVADGAGDTGFSAGDWAQVLSLCYAASREEASTPEPEWLRRAVEIWRTASHVGQLAEDGHNLSSGEARLFKQGVEASFIAATFSERPRLTMHWIAAGDCEAMLFRDGRLIKWGPVDTWKDFSSFPDGVSSKDVTSTNFQFDEWPLESHDTILFATDALACHVLRRCESMDPLPDSIDQLLSLGDWNEVRAWIEAARDEDLENDDVGIVRIYIEEDYCGSGPFILRREQLSAARVIEARRDLSILGPAPQIRRTAVEMLSQHESSGTPRPAVIEPSPPEAAWPFLDREADGLPTGTPAAPLPPFSWATFAAGGVAAVMLLAIAFSLADITGNQAPGIIQSAPAQNATIVQPPQKAIVEAKPIRSPTPPVIVTTQQAVVKPKPPADTAGQSSSLRDAGERRATRDFGGTGNSAPTQAAAPAREELSADAAPAGQVAASPKAVASPPAETAPATHADAGEADAGQDRPSAEAKSNAGMSCPVPKGTKLFAYGDERRKTPFLIVDAEALPCKAGPRGSGRMVLFTAWTRVPASSAPDALRWLDQRRLPDASNVWIAPNGEYLGNLKAGTLFVLKQRKQIDKNLWIELLITAMR